MDERVCSLEHDARVLAWRELGVGPPLLLLQGYAGTAADWDPQFLSALGRTFRVLCPDPRGMGASSVGNLEGPLTVESMAVDALAVLDACGIGEAVLVGWSMGGFVAQALARAAPQRVQALALLATDPGGPEAVRADPAVWARLVDHAGSPREQATRLLHLLFPSPLADAVDAEVGDLVAAGRARIDPRVLTAQETAIDRWHAASPLPALPAPLPTIAVAGSEDMVIPASNLALLAARWPGCRTTCIAGAGHAVMAQESERVAALVRDLAL